MISRILLAGLIASWGMLNFGMARDYAAASPASQWPNDVKALAAWLQHEFRSPQTLTGLTTDKPIGVYEEWNLAQWSDFLSLMSDGRNRFTLLKKEDISGEAAQALQHEYLIVRGIGEINGYNYTTQVGTWIVFRRRE
ncbi:hypothetical protein HYR69_06680 [Candidatus Sumerlaeota bacterium]|nr:hypothetical protein [Candidatus Sumerlaeota bacterium]